MSLCDSCRYQYYVEQLKPCIIRRDNCEFYEPDDFHKEPKTEIEFDEEQEQLDFVQPRKSIPVMLTATGHWITISEAFSLHKCSECEAVEYKKSKYCPNCGCHMIDPEESEGKG